jgi:hypothetical protein
MNRKVEEILNNIEYNLSEKEKLFLIKQVCTNDLSYEGLKEIENHFLNDIDSFVDEFEKDKTKRNELKNSIKNIKEFINKH